MERGVRALTRLWLGSCEKLHGSHRVQDVHTLRTTTKHIDTAVSKVNLPLHSTRQLSLRPSHLHWYPPPAVWPLQLLQAGAELGAPGSVEEETSET